MPTWEPRLGVGAVGSVPAVRSSGSSCPTKTMNKPGPKAILIAMALLALAAVVIWQQVQIKRVTANAAALREQAGLASAAREENQRLAGQLQAASEHAEMDRRELLRLRGQ